MYYRLGFENIPLEALENGFEALRLNPFIGPYALPYGEELIVELRLNKFEPEKYRKAGTILAIYLLHYGRFVKVGSSTINNVVIRMYSQAPLIGMIASLVILKQSKNANKIDNEIKRELLKKPAGNLEKLEKTIEIVTTKHSINRIVKSWLDQSKDKMDYLKELQELSRRIWDFIIRKKESFSEPLYRAGLHWFTCKTEKNEYDYIKSLGHYDHDSKFEKLTKLLKNNSSLKVEIKILSNGLCLITPLNWNYGILVPCDKVMYKFKIRVLA